MAAPKKTQRKPPEVMWYGAPHFNPPTITSTWTSNEPPPICFHIAEGPEPCIIGAEWGLATNKKESDISEKNGVWRCMKHESKKCLRMQFRSIATAEDSIPKIWASDPNAAGSHVFSSPFGTVKSVSNGVKVLGSPGFGGLFLWPDMASNIRWVRTLYRKKDEVQTFSN